MVLCKEMTGEGKDGGQLAELLNMIFHVLERGGVVRDTGGRASRTATPAASSSLWAHGCPDHSVACVDEGAW